MLVRSVIRDQVNNDPNVAAMRLGDQPIETFQRAELGMDAAIVANVVAPILERRGIDWAQPDRIDAERRRSAVVKIIEMRGNAVEVADSVTIGVGKTARINLVEDGLLPPFARHLDRSV